MPARRSFVATAAWAVGLAIGPALAGAQVVVPKGFFVDRLTPRLDNTTCRVEAITNPAFGPGAVVALISGDVLTVRKIGEGGISLLATIGVPPMSTLGDLRFGVPGAGFGRNLFIAVSSGAGSTCVSRLYEVSSDGAVNVHGPYGPPIAFTTFDFSAGAAGFVPGAYLLQNSGAHPQGESIMRLTGPDATPSLWTSVAAPGIGIDTDICSLRFDTTDAFSGRLLAVNTNLELHTCGMYWLTPEGVMSTLLLSRPTPSRLFTAMAVGGTDGQFPVGAYMTDTVFNAVMTLPAPSFEGIFINRFTDPESLSMSADGRVMYVSDANGVYRIRTSDALPGPVIVMREPSLPPGVPFAGPEAIASTRILWSAPITFSPADITITRLSDGQPVAFTATGSGSAFMILAFGQPLLNDTYTISIHDTAASNPGAVPIDGDADGFTGGDAVITMTHGPCGAESRCRADWDNNGVVNSTDVSSFINDWFEGIFKGCGG